MALSGLFASPVGGGSRSTMASSTAFTLRPVLAETPTASDASMPITSSICFLTRSSSADGRSILFEDGKDLEVVVERLIDVGERLRLHALACIDDQDRALAGGEAARHFVGEVHVPWACPSG